MEARNDGEAGSPLWTRDSPLTKRFIRLFYGIMNTYPEHLYLFYGDRSRVVVSEFGPTSPPVTQTADTQIKVRELLKTVHEGVRVTVKTAIPQISVEEGVLLLVSGILTKTSSTSNTEEDHCFTQSLMLAPQKQGYYVLTDTLHIMKEGDDKSTDTPFRWMEEEQANSQCFSFYPQIKTILSKSNTVQTTNSNNGLSSEAEPCEGPSEAKPLLDGIRKPSSKDTQDNGRPQANDEDINKPNKVKTTTVPKSTIPSRKTQAAHQRVNSSTRYTGLVGGGRIADATPITYRVGVPNPGPIMKTSHRSSSSNPPLMSVPPGKGVFIARLPFGIQPEEVVRIFSIFGPIVNGADGIQVRDGRNGCYAFVTFESAASAQAAIQNGAVVQGKRVFVEPRNPPHVENADPGFVSMHVGMPSPCVLAPPPPPPPPSALQLHQIPNIAPCVRRRAN